jgi:hypothetical protein
MKVFVLRDSKGKIIDYGDEIGALFDRAAVYESASHEQAEIRAENLWDVKSEIRKNVA